MHTQHSGRPTFAHNDPYSQHPSLLFNLTSPLRDAAALPPRSPSLCAAGWRAGWTRRPPAATACAATTCPWLLRTFTRRGPLSRISCTACWTAGGSGEVVLGGEGGCQLGMRGGAAAQRRATPCCLLSVILPCPAPCLCRCALSYSLPCATGRFTETDVSMIVTLLHACGLQLRAGGGHRWAGRCWGTKQVAAAARALATAPQSCQLP